MSTDVETVQEVTENAAEQVSEATEQTQAEEKKKRKRGPQGPRKRYRLGENRPLLDIEKPEDDFDSAIDTIEPTKHKEPRREDFQDDLDYWRTLVVFYSKAIEFSKEQIAELERYPDKDTRKEAGNMLGSAKVLADALADALSKEGMTQEVRELLAGDVADIVGKALGKAKE